MKVATGERYRISNFRWGRRKPIIAAPSVEMLLARLRCEWKKIPITTSDKKSSATARVNKNNRTEGLTRLPNKLKAPIASATSVGIATAQPCECVLAARNIRAGNTIPLRAHNEGSIASFAWVRPSRISRPINTKKMKVSNSESTNES